MTYSFGGMAPVQVETGYIVLGVIIFALVVTVSILATKQNSRFVVLKSGFSEGIPISPPGSVPKPEPAPAPARFYGGRGYFSEGAAGTGTGGGPFGGGSQPPPAPERFYGGRGYFSEGAGQILPPVPVPIPIEVFHGGRGYFSEGSAPVSPPLIGWAPFPQDPTDSLPGRFHGGRGYFEKKFDIY